MFLVITFWLADTNKPDFSTNILLRSFQKRLKFFVIFPNNLILVPSYMQKVMANNNCVSTHHPFLVNTFIYCGPCLKRLRNAHMCRCDIQNCYALNNLCKSLNKSFRINLGNLLSFTTNSKLALRFLNWIQIHF